MSGPAVADERLDREIDRNERLAIHLESIGVITENRFVLIHGLGGYIMVSRENVEFGMQTEKNRLRFLP